MNRDESLLIDKTRNDIDDFDQSDDAYPNIEPNGDVQNRKQPHQTNDDKNNIRNRVQVGTQLACRMSPSRDPAIQNIGNSGSEVQGVESRRKTGQNNKAMLQSIRIIVMQLASAFITIVYS